MGRICRKWRSKRKIVCSIWTAKVIDMNEISELIHLRRLTESSARVFGRSTVLICEILRTFGKFWFAKKCRLGGARSLGGIVDRSGSKMAQFVHLGGRVRRIPFVHGLSATIKQQCRIPDDARISSRTNQIIDHECIDIPTTQSLLRSVLLH